jgi:hypothetical protein
MLKKYTLFIGIVSFLPNFAPDFECEALLRRLLMARNALKINTKD